MQRARSCNQLQVPAWSDKWLRLRRTPSRVTSRGTVFCSGQLGDGPPRCTQRTSQSGAHAVLICDCAGLHQTGRRLCVLDNVTLLLCRVTRGSSTRSRTSGPFSGQLPEPSRVEQLRGYRGRLLRGMVSLHRQCQTSQVCHATHVGDGQQLRRLVSAVEESTSAPQHLSTSAAPASWPGRPTTASLPPAGGPARVKPRPGGRTARRRNPQADRQ